VRKGLGPAVVQGHDFERVVEEEGPDVPPAQEADADPIDLRIEFRVRLERVASDPDLVEGEVSRVPAERGHVPVTQGLKRERRGHD
jgi:hypothetical protein